MLKIAVDFDGTIVTHAYPQIGREIPFAIDTLKTLQQKHNAVIILWTVRAGELLDDAVEYCRRKGLEFYAVNKNFMEEVLDENISRKLNVDLFIDDRNLGGIPDWGTIYKMISEERFLEPAPQQAETEYEDTKKKGFFGKIFG